MSKDELIAQYTEPKDKHIWILCYVNKDGTATFYRNDVIKSIQGWILNGKLIQCEAAV